MEHETFQRCRGPYAVWYIYVCWVYFHPVSWFWPAASLLKLWEDGSCCQHYSDCFAPNPLLLGACAWCFGLEIVQSILIPVCSIEHKYSRHPCICSIYGPSAARHGVGIFKAIKNSTWVKLCTMFARKGETIWITLVCEVFGERVKWHQLQYSRFTHIFTQVSHLQCELCPRKVVLLSDGKLFRKTDEAVSKWKCLRKFATQIFKSHICAC